MTQAPPNANVPYTHRDLSPLAWAAIGVGAIALLALGSALWPTLVAIVTPGPESAEAAEQDQERRIAQFNERLVHALALAQGRSMFVVPPAPDAIAQAEREKAKAAAAAPDEGPAPARYSGPDPIAVINNTVWFSDSTQIAVGKERGGIRVVSVDRAPWTVRLKWRNVEFDVPIFENTTPSFLSKKPTTTSERP